MPIYTPGVILSWVKNLFKSTQEALMETAQDVKDGMMVEGAPVSYPIQWDSERQKRAYFATGGFGSGIPYQRTGSYTYGGEVIEKPYGAQFFNPHPAGAIGGALKGWQSSIHAGRWPHLLDVIRMAVAKLPQRIRNKVVTTEGEL
jgi:hypothetical protein